MVKRKATMAGDKQPKKKAKKQESNVRVFAFRISLEKDKAMFDEACIKAMKQWVKKEFHKYIMQVENSFLEKSDDEIEMLEAEGISHNIHLQGYGRMDEKQRPGAVLKRMLSAFPGKSVYCAAASENGAESLKKYCMKDETRMAGPWADKAVYLGEDLITPGQMVGFQKWICKLLPRKPSKRLTYWFYCPDGGSGKSAIAKYLAYHFDVPTYTFAKAWDLLKLVSMEPNKKMYIINLSKTKPAEVASEDLYNVIESIKDGNFCSYKGSDVQRVLMNPPHLVVMANEAPKKEFLTQKRLKVFKLMPLPAHLLDDADDEPEMEEGMEIFVPQTLVTGCNVAISGLGGSRGQPKPTA